MSILIIAALAFALAALALALGREMRLRKALERLLHLVDFPMEGPCIQNSISQSRSRGSQH